MVPSGVFAAALPPDDKKWIEYFTEVNAQGTLVVVDSRAGKEIILVHDRDRATYRLSPASTFKIPHSLIALDAGVLRDEFQVIPWDGVKRPVDEWNHDQDLRSAVRNSAVWVFERFAREIGREKEAAYMRNIPYGNALSSGAEPFWVEGDLAISAQEQVVFLRHLYENTLPFRVEHQLIVKDVLINEAGRDWILRAKSGWTGKIGWWVGWVEWPQGPVYFALNIDTPNRMEDLPKREKIVRQVLRSLDALPG
ncbi:class D beta-lactamase [Paraburkholderia sp. SG-MS1]|uniref:class D beta-lactamase n=1 Tax=Paraburkholderia sp. SG-MS1 TaxID=2023741 RepID=UPI00406BEFFE